MNVFTWWPKVSETLNNSIENLGNNEQNDINNKKLDSDWANLYWKLPDNNKIWDILQQEAEEKNSEWFDNFNNTKSGIQEKTPEEEAIDFQKQRDKIVEKNKYFPIFNRLHATWEILDSTYENILNNINSNNGWIDLSRIETANKDETEVIEWTLVNFNENQNRWQNLVELQNDKNNLLKIEWLDKADFEINEDTFETEFNNEVLNKIGKNYLKFPDKDWNFDIKEDFSTAIISTKNEILNNVENIRITSETYKVAIKNINSWDINKQMEWIENLYMLAYSNEWTLWKTTLSKFKIEKEKKLKIEAIKIEKELNSELTKNEEEIDNLNKRKKEIIAEMQELTWIKNWEKVEWWSLFAKVDKIEVNKENIEA